MVCSTKKQTARVIELRIENARVLDVFAGTGAIALEALIDGSSMHGGFFDLGSATYNMTRLVTGQLDAYVDLGATVLSCFPETEPSFRVAGDAEITVECNPESVTRPKLEAYGRAGVTRISLGVQSLEDAILARLGRLHDARAARGAFEAARTTTALE